MPLMSRRRQLPGGSARLGGFMTAGALSFGLLPTLPPCLPAITRSAAPSAGAARVISLNENGYLHAIGKHDLTLNEKGSASGTIRGTIYVHLTVVSTSQVTAEVSIYPSGGSITGYATAGYRRGITTASFSGSMSISRGTGSYEHAHGPGLSFSGTIQRSNDAVTVHLSGRVWD
ncbi:MAG TPA: hypothetical protein VES97_09065 [Solirubrobacteraceae bacterium]|nr:hypothetical protein [Solirubrobacteraceae bacterium]